MFAKCPNLVSVKLGSIHAPHLYYTDYMFQNCIALTTVDTADWEIFSQSAMSYMFDGCSSLTSLDLSSWGVGDAYDLDYMFRNCTSLMNLNVSGWGLGSACYLQGVFSGCTALRTLDLHTWSLASALYTSEMFANCTHLESVDFSGLSAGSLRAMNGMFRNCFSLRSIDFSHAGTLHGYNMYDMFHNCTSLNALSIGRNFRFLGECSLPAGVWRADSDGRTISSEEFWNNDEDVLWTDAFQLSETWRFVPAAPDWANWPAIHLPDDLREIQEEALAEIHSDLVIYIPDSLTSIADTALGFNETYERVLVLSPDSPMLDWALAYEQYAFPLKVRVAVRN